MSGRPFFFMAHIWFWPLLWSQVPPLMVVLPAGYVFMLFTAFASFNNGGHPNDTPSLLHRAWNLGGVDMGDRRAHPKV